MDLFCLAIPLSSYKVDKACWARIVHSNFGSWVQNWPHALSKAAWSPSCAPVQIQPACLRSLVRLHGNISFRPDSVLGARCGQVQVLWPPAPVLEWTHLLPSSGHGLFHIRKKQDFPISDMVNLSWMARKRKRGQKRIKVPAIQPSCLHLVQWGENHYSATRRFI